MSLWSVRNVHCIYTQNDCTYKKVVGGKKADDNVGKMSDDISSRKWNQVVLGVSMDHQGWYYIGCRNANTISHFYISSRILLTLY